MQQKVLFMTEEESEYKLWEGGIQASNFGITLGGGLWEGDEGEEGKAMEQKQALHYASPPSLPVSSLSFFICSSRTVGKERNDDLLYTPPSLYFSPHFP